MKTARACARLFWGDHIKWKCTTRAVGTPYNSEWGQKRRRSCLFGFRTKQRRDYRLDVFGVEIANYVAKPKVKSVLYYERLHKILILCNFLLVCSHAKVCYWDVYGSKNDTNGSNTSFPFTCDNVEKFKVMIIFR